jgi:hypothetical protein
MRMNRSFFYLFIVMLLGSIGTAVAQGEIYGRVLDEKNQPFDGAVIKVNQGGISKGMSSTDEDGTFRVKPLSPGTYEVEISAISYTTKKMSGVQVTVGDATNLKDIKLNVAGQNLKAVEVITYKKPLTTKVVGKTSDEIEKAPTRSILDMASLGPNAQQSRNGAGVRLGGARLDGTAYMIDGQMVQQGSIQPAQGTVDQLQVFSSGIPANLGDVTGGMIVITSKSMTSTLKGNVQAQRSFDGYNQNLINGSITGPLLSKEVDGFKKPILGFMLGMDYQYDQDSDPTFFKNPRLKSDALERLRENPLSFQNTANGSQMVPNANYVTDKDFEYKKQSINNSSQNFRTNGKLDFALNDNINITTGGNFSYNKSDGYSRAYSYFAPDAIPVTTGYTGRGYLRFKQSFNNPKKVAEVDSNGKKKESKISNAYYTVQIDYQQTGSSTQDANFKRNLFDYAYVGKFDQQTSPIYAMGIDSVSGRQAMILQTYDAQTGMTFNQSDKNRTLGNYTKNVFDQFGNLGGITGFTDVQRNKGHMNGDMPTYMMDIQNVRLFDVGAGLTGYNYSRFNQLGVHADASFDLKIGKTVHAIQFGLYFEQRARRAYSASINPRGEGNNSLWSQMNNYVNQGINGLDYSNPRFIHNGVEYSLDSVNKGAFFGPTDTIIYNRKFNEGNQSVFDANLRSKLGVGNADYLNIYGVDPSNLSLGMFSADELIGTSSNSSRFVSYNGYDYTGNIVKGQVSFNDFWTAKGADGRLSRPIGAFMPNYIAGYIMDQFRLDKLKFNIGVRIERYDNNTRVLKDPYSLYELQYAGSADGKFNIANGGVHPGNIDKDYAVYVDNNTSLSPKILGYRKGDIWYNNKGVEVLDPKVLAEGTDPQALLTDAGKVGITDQAFNPNNSFTDYAPKITASPRFQFDFPINDDKALFYAHYDILVQRPKIGNFATPLDYYLLPSFTGGEIIQNPNLKPEKTFDYEMGYQQQVGTNSVFGISAFYRERKDMIQVRPYIYATPKTYYSFGNRDFSTTKGFTFTYDYRKPKDPTIPISMTLAYTLQFADGTGSDAASSNGGRTDRFTTSGLLQNFITAGLPNLRYVNPLNYDARHNLSLNINYSYGEKEGPTVNNKHFLQNFNANMILRARSGEPYTTYQNVIGNAIQGGLNGTRLGWHFGIDLRLDKRFQISGFEKRAVEGETATPVADKKKHYLSAFIYCQNIFNIKDVLGVYPYTSRPDDDGYITSPTGQQTINNTMYNPTTSYMLYSMYVNNPGYYNGPRRLFAGVSFSF